MRFSKSTFLNKLTHVRLFEGQHFDFSKLQNKELIQSWCFFKFYPEKFLFDTVSSKTWRLWKCNFGPLMGFLSSSQNFCALRMHKIVKRLSYLWDYKKTTLPFSHIIFLTKQSNELESSCETTLLGSCQMKRRQTENDSNQIYTGSLGSSRDYCTLSGTF